MKPCYQDNRYHTQKPLSGHIIPEINPEDPGQIQLLFLSGHFDDQEEDVMTTLKSSEPTQFSKRTSARRKEIVKLLPLHWQQGLRSSGNPGSGPGRWDRPWGAVNGSHQVGGSGWGLAHDLLQEGVSKLPLNRCKNPN